MHAGGGDVEREFCWTLVALVGKVRVEPGRRSRMARSCSSSLSRTADTLLLTAVGDSALECLHTFATALDAFRSVLGTSWTRPHGTRKHGLSSLDATSPGASIFSRSLPTASLARH
jgi:hypothetical protein